VTAQLPGVCTAEICDVRLQCSAATMDLVIAASKQGACTLRLLPHYLCGHYRLTRVFTLINPPMK
jgi:hypothetical protein